MIKISCTFTAKGPLHTGSDVNAGTLRSLRRQKTVLATPLSYSSVLTDADRLNAVTHILLGVWYGIDWDGIKGKRIMGIWDEFAGKLLAATRCGNKYEFLETLCRSWGIQSLGNSTVLQALDALADWELLETVRTRSVYLILKLRALKDIAKEQRQEEGRLAFELAPIQPGPRTAVVRTEDWLPCISGNSIRGKMRRLAMLDFCRRTGITRMTKRCYHTLFAGGFLDSSTQYEDFDRMEKFVSMCPMLGMLGAGIGNMTIEGDAKIGWAYPQCLERGTGGKSYWQYLDTVFQTRHDASRREDKIELTGEDQTQQMKYEYEVFADGTPFDWRLACVSEHPLMVSAWWHLLRLFADAPYIGGMSAVGNGEIALDWTIEDGGAVYCEYLDQHAPAIREFWESAEI